MSNEVRKALIGFMQDLQEMDDERTAQLELIEKAGRTEEFLAEVEALVELYPEWMALLAGLLDKLLPPTNVHPIIALFHVLPESVARNAQRRMQIANAIVQYQIDDILKERFPAEQNTKTEDVK